MERQVSNFVDIRIYYLSSTLIKVQSSLLVGCPTIKECLCDVKIDILKNCARKYNVNLVREMT